MSFPSIKVQKLEAQATLPTRAHPNDAGMDLYALEDVVLEPGQGRRARTGIAVEIPDGFVGMIADRSSLASKGLKTAGGIIDSGYRGEVQIVFWNLSQETLRANRGDRIAQMLLIPIATPAIQEAETLAESSRGAGGFGSSGK